MRSRSSSSWRSICCLIKDLIDQWPNQRVSRQRRRLLVPGEVSISGSFSFDLNCTRLVSNVVDEALSVCVETELDGEVVDVAFNPTMLHAHVRVRPSRTSHPVENTQRDSHEFQVTTSFLGAAA